jgi:hypothetical protein
MGIAGHRLVALHLQQSPRLSTEWGPPHPYVLPTRFQFTLNQDTQWVRDVVLGSGQSPADRKSLENKCRRWESNPHALAGNGF